MTLAELRQEATEAAEWRGHSIEWEPPRLLESIQTGNCTQCDAWVQVCTKPAPNGIGIGGPAVAIHCGD